MLEENEDHRYRVFKEEGGTKTLLETCDKLAAEEFALLVEESGRKIKWIYPEDQFLSPAPMW